MKRKICSATNMMFSVVLMAQPNGIALAFAPSPTKRVISFYSYFSPIPFGYGNWFPIITAILSIVIIALLLISLKKYIKNAIEICLGITISASLLSWLLFGTFSLIGLMVLILHVVTLFIQLIPSDTTK